jgi:hypothetical protein
MTIKIVKCKENLWYSNRIGDKFEVKEASDHVKDENPTMYNAFWANNNLSDFYYAESVCGFISKGDCDLV